MRSNRVQYSILLIVFLTSSSSVNSQSDSCDSTLKISDFPFDASSSKCLTAWARENFILRFQKTSVMTWSFVLSAPDRGGYVAVGYSINGRMKGASAIIGWGADSTGNPGIKQYYLGGYEPIDAVADGGNLRVNSSKIIRNVSRLYLAFQLELPGNPSPHLIFAVGPSKFQPDPPAFKLAEHRADSAMVVDYSSGQINEQVNSYEKLRRAHGILNAFSWGFLMIIGALVARHLKSKDPLWFYSHFSIQLVSFTLGLLGVITGIILEKRLHEEADAHKAIGIFILVLACLQIVGGLARPNKESKIRKYWNRVHHISGGIALGLAIFNVFYGFRLGEEGKGWAASYGVVLAVLFVVSVVLEIRVRRM